MTSNIRQTFVAAATCAVEARSGVPGDFSLGGDGDEMDSSPMGQNPEEMDALPAWMAELPGSTENYKGVQNRKDIPTMGVNPSARVVVPAGLGRTRL
jgi:hypothetical protein